MDAADVLSPALKKYRVGEVDAAYLADAVEAALMLLGGEVSVVDDDFGVEYPTHGEQVARGW